MQSKAKSPEAYIDELTEPRKSAVLKLREAVKKGLPDGFEETMQYGMITFVVPHRLYSAGYHVNPKDPLPFLSIASQKQYISLYHLGLYADPALMAWFRAEYEKAGVGRLFMGKSCIRFKREDGIPYALIEELASKISVREYIKMVNGA
jgi:uncharacterized protein YdhG (YjbR/CyaY superfamily)